MWHTVGMRPHIWILDGHTPVPADDVHDWALWFESATRQGLRRVAGDEIEQGFLSTVFLGSDYNFDQEGPALLFETMLFDQTGEGNLIERYATWDDALTGHRAALILLQAQVLA